MKYLTVSQMKKVEKEANEKGVSYEQMMETAGKGVGQIVADNYEDVPRRGVLGLVGPGNNGGDTLIALEYLARQGWKALAYCIRPRLEKDALAQRLRSAGGELVAAAEDKDGETLEAWLSESDVLLDGLLGTGTRLPLKPEFAQLLNRVAAFQPGPQVVAVDCPSGVDCDRGTVADETLAADVTVVMQAVKAGLLKFPAFNKVGRIEMVDLNLPSELAGLEDSHARVLDHDIVAGLLPERPNDAHKGTFGTALIVAGSINYTGAVLLAGRAAYRIGTGLVRMAIPGPLHLALAGHLPEATWVILPHEQGVISANAGDVLIRHMERVTAMLVGPGLGQENTTGEFLQHVIGSKPSRAAKGTIGFLSGPQENNETNSVHIPPLVIDADGLNLLAKIPDWSNSLPRPAVLTPHPGEMARLTGLTSEEIQQDRLAVAKKYAAEWDAVVVLKGALTVVAAPDGAASIVPVATPALARAGTGDVLAGMVCGLLAQGVEPYAAACAAAWIHAEAGLAAAEWVGGTASVLASDVLDAVPEVIQGLQ
ncbi:MAG: NAD(P)H-hydrate dehydratase [Chloroflexi bacterium]|nr:NAD(P)H-hydrate dehydratase [Chloroflexota bacterium]